MGRRLTAGKMAAVVPVGVPVQIVGEKPPECEPTLDAVHQRLAAMDRIEFKQGHAVMEALTCGMMPNLFTITDKNFMYQPVRDGSNYGDPIPYPMFIVEEKMDDCCSRDFCCRCCCNPGHPSVTELYVASPPIAGQSHGCGPCKCHEPDFSTKVGEPVMTYERLGCCHRWANCFVCCEMCQDEMRFHRGGGLDVNKAGDNDTTNVIAVGKVPIGGGGCTPTVELFQTPPGTVDTKELEPAAVVEGPTCFGGLKDWCCDTTFTVSDKKGGEGNFAKITKLKPTDCSSCCRAMCTTADVYDVEFTPGTMAPEQKALVVGELVHLDYMFFEKDRFPITCEKKGDTNYLHILCCLCYCYGCLCPCNVSIPCKAEGGGGG